MMPYLLRKNGMWYSLNSCGYTARAELAELYSEQEAKEHAAGSPEVHAIPLCEAITNVDRLKEHHHRIGQMIEVLET